MKRLLLLVMFILVCTVAWAANRYVDPDCTIYNGDGTTTGCAVSLGGNGAYNTWPTGWLSTSTNYYQKAGTADTVIVKIQLQNNQTVGSYSTGAKPIINITVGTFDSNNDTIFDVISKNGITIDGFDLRATNNRCIYVTGANNLTIKNNDLTSNVAGLYIWTNTVGTNDLLVDGNNFYTTGFSAERFNTWSRGWTITNNTFDTTGTSAAPLQIDPTSNNPRNEMVPDTSLYDFNISYNTVNNSAYGFIIVGQSITGTNYIGHNTFNNIGLSDAHNSNALQLFVDGTTIENNICIEVTETVQYSDGHCIELDKYTSPDLTSKNNIVRKNRASGCTGAGIDLWGSVNGLVYDNIIYGNSVGIGLSNAVSTENAFYNNTSYGNVRGFSLASSAAASTWKNNISSGNSSKAWYTDGSNSAPTETDNLIYGTSDISLHASDITSDPLLTENFFLNVNSPARNMGADLSSIFTTDKNGYTWVDWDLGALKYPQDNSDVPSVETLNATLAVKLNGTFKFNGVLK